MVFGMERMLSDDRIKPHNNEGFVHQATLRVSLSPLQAIWWEVQLRVSKTVDHYSPQPSSHAQSIKSLSSSTSKHLTSPQSAVEAASTTVMRAARYYGAEDIRIEDIPEPECGEGQVKVSPAFVGICGTDLHEYISGPYFTPAKPHPVTKETIPITLGHEFSGTIKEVGKGVTDFKVGQPIVVKPTIFCASCSACKLGVDNACPKGGFIGLSGGGGGLSDALVVAKEKVLPLPDNVPLDVAALVEPLAVAWHAVSIGRVEPGSTCLVLGGGPIGLAVIQCLLAKNVSRVIVSEVASRRQQFAKDFGAHHVLNPTQVDVISEVRKITGDAGADYAFDCAGVPASLKTACLAVKSRGTVVNVAIWEKEVPFNPNWLVFREANYQAVLGYNLEDFSAVIDGLGRGALKPKQMITSKIKMENLVADGFVPLIKEKDKHVKILIDINPKS